jgi:hypothetical protein
MAGRRYESQGFGLQKNCEENNSNFVKREVRGDSGPLDLGGHMVDIYVFWRKNPSEKIQGGEYPKSSEPKKS